MTGGGSASERSISKVQGCDGSVKTLVGRCGSGWSSGATASGDGCWSRSAGTKWREFSLEKKKPKMNGWV